MEHGKSTWIWTDHILHQMEERKISRELVEAALDNPDDKMPGKKNRLVYQKISDDKLIRIITEGNKLITAYVTDKVKKYMRG